MDLERIVVQSIGRSFPDANEVETAYSNTIQLLVVLALGEGMKTALTDEKPNRIRKKMSQQHIGSQIQPVRYAEIRLMEANPAHSESRNQIAIRRCWYTSSSPSGISCAMHA